MFSALMPSPWASVAFVAGTILDLQLADSFARVLGSAAEAGAVELMPIGLGEPRRIVGRTVDTLSRGQPFEGLLHAGLSVL